MIYWGMCLVAFVWVGLDYLSKTDFLRYPDEQALSYLDEQALTACIVMTEFSVLWFSSLLAGYTFGPDRKGSLPAAGSRWCLAVGDLVEPLGRHGGGPAATGDGLALGAIWLLMAYNELLMLRPLAVLIVMLSYVSVLVIGQACSMFVRSRIIALVVAPVMTGCFASWIATGVFWAGLGWKLGAARYYFHC